MNNGGQKEDNYVCNSVIKQENKEMIRHLKLSPLLGLLEY